MTITKSYFTYNHADCSEEFMNDKYISFRKWFFNTFNEEQQQLYKKLFYEYIDEHETSIPFVIFNRFRLPTRELEL